VSTNTITIPRLRVGDHVHVADGSLVGDGHHADDGLVVRVYERGVIVDWASTRARGLYLPGELALDRRCDGCRGTGVQLVCGSTDSGLPGHRIETEPCRICRRRALTS